MSSKDKNGAEARDRLQTDQGRPANDDRAKPLVEEVEDEMEDQDIPVETGIRPDPTKR